MKNIAELRELKDEELKEKLVELRKTQFQLRLKKSSGSLDKTHDFKLVRREIARIKTLLTQRFNDARN